MVTLGGGQALGATLTMEASQLERHGHVSAISLGPRTDRKGLYGHLLPSTRVYWERAQPNPDGILVPLHSPHILQCLPCCSLGPDTLWEVMIPAPGEPLTPFLPQLPLLTRTRPEAHPESVISALVGLASVLPYRKRQM